jgi:hypothetical protein
MAMIAEPSAKRRPSLREATSAREDEGKLLPADKRFRLRDVILKSRA